MTFRFHVILVDMSFVGGRRFITFTNTDAERVPAASHDSRGDATSGPALFTWKRRDARGFHHNR